MLSFLKKLFKQPKPPINPAIFEHPLALQTSWAPKSHGGSNFKTRTLQSISNQKIVFQPSGVSKFIVILGLVGCVIAIVVLGVKQFTDDNVFSVTSLPPVLIPILPLSVLGVIAYFAFRPIVFDKKNGYFYKSYGDPSKMASIPTKKRWIPLESVMALQIISERVKTKNSSYQSYELNLVFSSGERYNVLDHSHYKDIQEDCRSIANFIGIPYWDAVSEESYIPPTLRSSGGNFGSETEKPYDSTQPHATVDEPYDSLKDRRL